MTTLRDIGVGQSVRVVSLNASGALKQRIMDMGITKGTEITVNKIAPLGDPIGCKVRGYELSLRKDEAQYIEVQ